MSRNTLRLAPLVVVALALACGSPPPPPPADQPSRSGTAVIGVLGDVRNWNPYLADSAFSENLLALVYPSLAVEQADYRDHPPSFEPALASSWEWSEDRLTLTFHLRQDATWSDGVPVTAADVVFSWRTQVSDAVDWPGVFDKAAITAVEARDDHTVDVRFSRTYPYQLMDANEGLIIPAHAWSSIPYESWEETDWSRLGLAAGPFRLARLTPNQEIVLEANPSFWDRARPLLERVVFRVVPDPTGLNSQFRSGALDFVENVPPADAERLRDDPRTTVVVYPDRSYTFVAWNNDHPVLGDVEVRRALTLAIDRQTVLQTVRRGFGRLAGGPVLSGMWAFNHGLEPLPFDPGRARELLAEAGFTDHDGDGLLDREGKTLSLELLTNSESQDRRDVAVLVQRDLERIGVVARTRFLEHGAVLDRRDRGEFDAVISSWLEPTQVDLHDIWHSAPADEETNNFVRYANPEVDALIERVTEASDFAAQKPLFDRIQELILADQPYTFLYERDAVAGLSRRIGGAVVNDATPFFNLDSWYIRPDSR